MTINQAAMTVKENKGCKNNGRAFGFETGTCVAGN
jgi:hypothetical protein